jgi:alpha-1,2-glucosyltransferase
LEGTNHSVNIVFSSLTFLYLYKIFDHQQQETQTAHDDSQTNTISLSLSWILYLFPLHYFFIFLYYTDCGSVLFIIIAYYYAKQRSLFISSLFCIISILFRQTNIVWTFWIAAESLIQEDSFRSVKKYWNFIFIGILFLIFAYVNRGIVVGDRTNHIAITHVPQFFYFVSFCILMIPFYWIGKWRNAVHWIVIPLTVLFGFLAFHFNYTHIFTLSDNRHYTFYLWRRLFKIHVDGQSKLIYVYYAPIFAVSFVLIWRSLKSNSFDSHLLESVMWKVLFFFCVAANVIPMPLVEFRYFLTPFFLLFLNLDFKDWDGKWMSSQVFYFVSINAVTFWIFVKRTFAYGNDIGRIMW